MTTTYDLILKNGTVVNQDGEGVRDLAVKNGRIYIPDDPIGGDADFNALMDAIRRELMSAIDRVMTCRPQHMIMGMSSETFWGGLEASKELKRRVEERAGVNVTMGSDASQAALRRYGAIKRLGIVTPYMPVGDEQVRRFFADWGFEVVHLKGLRCRSPSLIAHVAEKDLRDAILEVNDSSVEAIVQVGTNLAMARVAGIAEFWLDKPVIAINTATYWHALRTNGITDRIHGFGSLLVEH
jgi:maleate isomerase